MNRDIIELDRRITVLESAQGIKKQRPLKPVNEIPTPKLHKATALEKLLRRNKLFQSNMISVNGNVGIRSGDTLVIRIPNKTTVTGRLSSKAQFGNILSIAQSTDDDFDGDATTIHFVMRNHAGSPMKPGKYQLNIWHYDNRTQKQGGYTVHFRVF